MRLRRSWKDGSSSLLIGNQSHCDTRNQMVIVAAGKPEQSRFSCVYSSQRLLSINNALNFVNLSLTLIIIVAVILRYSSDCQSTSPVNHITMEDTQSWAIQWQPMDRTCNNNNNHQKGEEYWVAALTVLTSLFVSSWPAESRSMC